MTTGSARTRPGGQMPQGGPLYHGPSTGGSRHGWIVWLVVIVIGTGIGLLIWRAVKTQGSATKTRKGLEDRGMPVEVARASLGDLPVYLSGLLGTVTPLQTVTIHTLVDGELIKVAFVEGQIVHQGDLLAQIDPGPYEAALLAAQGALLRDEASLANAKVDLDRYKRAPDAYTQQQIDTQQALVYQNEGTVKNDEGMVQSAQVNLNYCTITSPVSGRTGLRLVDQGNIVHTTDTTGLVVITQLQPITIVFPMREQDIPDVIGGAQAVPPLEVDALNEENDTGKPIAKGKLIAINSEVDPTSGTVQLKAEFANTHLELFPQNFVNVRLLIKTLQNVVLVPEEAIQLGPDGNFVYLVNRSDTTVDVRPVTEGESEGDMACVTSGLSAGDIVVTMGVDKLAKGSKVSFDLSAATRGPTTEASATTQPGGHHHHRKTQDADGSGSTARTGE